MREEIKNIYRKFDVLYKSTSFSEIEKLLKEVDFVETKPTLLVAYLSASFAGYRNGVISPAVYGKFYNDVFDILDIIGDNPKETLAGLEPKEKK